MEICQILLFCFLDVKGCRLRRLEEGEARAVPWNPINGLRPLHPPFTDEGKQSSTTITRKYLNDKLDFNTDFLGYKRS